MGSKDPNGSATAMSQSRAWSLVLNWCLLSVIMGMGEAGCWGELSERTAGPDVVWVVPQYV